ncbi:MAG: type II secretion system protein [Desulfatibacillaceae bacterium]|nr:type II secretion system protein [Desulfatibacillaceae bacterium]
MERELLPIRAKFQSAFTLLEVLMAIFVFAVVMSLVFGSWKATLDNTAQTQKSLGLYFEVKTSLARMSQDISSLHAARPPDYKPPTSALSEPDPYRIQTSGIMLGDPGFPTLRFVSRAHADLTGTGLTGLSEIVYYVTRERGADESFVLRRKDSLAWDLFESAPVLDPVLCQGIEKISFVFIDNEGRTHDAWDSESPMFGYATPRAVGIILEIAPDSQGARPLVFETRVDLPIFRDPVS